MSIFERAVDIFDIGDEARIAYSETGLTPRQLAEQRAELLSSIVMARAYIASRCGTPDPADRYADQVLIEIHKTIDATISKCEAAQ